MIWDRLKQTFRTFKSSSVARRIPEAGWALIRDQASIIWDDPQPFARHLPKPLSSKSVQKCPAALDFEARHFVIPCPIDVRVKFAFNEQNKPTLIHVGGDQSAIRGRHLTQMMVLVAQQEWRHPKRPLVQIITPYLFLSDDPLYINQLPPFLDYLQPAWPGVLISGRFPIHLWPRPLMWAFEWHDTTQDLVLERGAPWFYVRLEAQDPTRPVRLVEAELTPEVQKFIQSVSGVTNYVKQTFSLFETARRRRPRRLLIPKSSRR